MHYYEHHIGDYAAATAHLSLIEDAVYSRMLRRYYLQEGPLPSDPEAVARLIGAREEVAVVKAILVEFFTLADDGWHQKRADEDIERVRVKAKKASDAAKARWNKENVKTECDGNANASAEHNERNAPKTQDPSSKLQVKAEAGDACPHAEIVALYHELLPANPRIKAWAGGRQANLRTRWREDPKRQSLDYWRRFFRHVAASPFLTGRIPDRNGRSFLPGLDWLVKPDNFAKVIENRYHDREPQA